MSHEIAFINGKACIAVAEGSEIPWHRLANWTAVDAGRDVWAQNSGLDFVVKRAKVRYPANAADASNPDAWRVMDDRHVLLHSTTGNALGIVSDRYKIFQPRQVVDYICDLAEQYGLKLDVMGLLYEGKQCWALAKYDESQIVLDARDKIGGYVLIRTSFDGTSGTEFYNTSVRVVCRNTLAVATQGKAAHKVTHRKVVDVTEANAALGFKVDAYKADFAASMDSLRHLARMPWTPAAMARATLELFAPAKAKVEDMDAKSRTEILEKHAAKTIATLAITSRDLIGADMRGGSGTAFAWLNSVTQFTDHNSRAHSVESRWDSALFGNGADLKSKAMAIALEMTA